MSLHIPAVAGYGWRVSSFTARPVNSPGTSVAPGNNTKGSWSQLLAGASVTSDVWLVHVNFHAVSASAAIRDCIADIGIDPAGGSSYTVLLPDLLCSCAGSIALSTGMGIDYLFPIHIPSGASVAVRFSVNNATVGSARCWIRCYGKPEHPELTRKGQVCQAIGITAASSSGTAVTPGTTSEGTWTSLGTLTRQAWWWQLGIGIADATMTDNILYACDLSAGSAGGDSMIIEDQMVGSNSAEQLTYRAPLGQGARTMAAGVSVFGRMQCSGTADSALSMAAYAVS
jgi:hypothetical protein